MEVILSDFLRRYFSECKTTIAFRGDHWDEGDDNSELGIENGEWYFKHKDMSQKIKTSYDDLSGQIVQRVSEGDYKCGPVIVIRGR